MTSFECTNCVFNITNENNSFSIIILGCSIIPNYLEENIIDKLENLLKPKSQSNIESPVKEVRKRSNQIKTGSRKINDQILILFRKKLLEELRNTKDHDLENLVFRMGLLYDEIMDVLAVKYFPPERMGCTLQAGKYEISDHTRTLEFLPPDFVKVIITLDDIGLRSKLNINHLLIFTKSSFFYTTLGFIQSHEGLLNDIEGFIQLIPGKYKSENSINITGFGKVHLKANCVDRSIVDGIRELILYSFAPSSPPGHKIIKEPRIKHFK